MIAQIAELPLPLVDLEALLALEVDRLAPDRDYAGFGMAWAERLELAAPDRPSVWLARALVVALHSADEQTCRGDVELLFELPDQSVIVPLSAWLDAFVPRLPATQDVVLALCNPDRVAIEAPPAAPRLHVALGDVTSWRDDDGPGRSHVRLSARAWRVAPPRSETP